MLTDWRLWKRYPLLIAVRLAQNTIRTTALLFLVVVLALATTTKKVADLPVGFMAVALGLNWALMGYFAVRLRRSKLLLYPLMFVLNPLLNWYYMVYGILTAGQRTWGGPRADAAAADEDTTPREAIERAALQGDDLNIVPESFGGVVATTMTTTTTTMMNNTRTMMPTTPIRRRSVVRPPDELDGRFAARTRTDDGLYVHLEDTSASSEPGPASGRAREGSPVEEHVNMGVDEEEEEDYAHPLPRPFASIMGAEDRRKYELAQQQRCRWEGDDDGNHLDERPSSSSISLVLRPWRAGRE